MTREEAIKLIEHISIAFVPTDQYGDYDDPQPYEEAIDMAIEALQTLEAVERIKTEVLPQTDLVRCKDCRHHGMRDCPVWGDDTTEDYMWCYYGERREE